jgi:hypothetical protein
LVVVVPLFVASSILVLLAAPASAQEAPSITVTPSTGLRDGQTVTVDGTGFSPNATTFGSLTVGLCPADIVDDVTQASLRCGATVAFPVPVDDNGVFQAQLQVFRNQPTLPGDGTLRCTDAPHACVVLALEVTGTPPDFGLVTDTAPVTFRPETKADCKHGGWRNLTDDRGRPFRNQGRCIRFVTHHP